MKTLQTIFLNFMQACLKGPSDERNVAVASEQIFPLVKGNYWIYETKYVKGEEIQEWKDTLKIGEKKIIDGVEGRGLDKSTTHAFHIGSMYPLIKIPSIT